MRKLFFFIFSFLLVLAVLPSVSANSVGINTRYVGILRWEETDYVEKHNLKVSMVLTIYLEDELFDKNITNLIFKINPTEPGHSGEGISNVNFDICGGSMAAHSYGDIPINCITRLKYNESIDEHKVHYFNVSLNENISKNDDLVIKIDYTIVNFLDKNDDKLIILHTDCNVPEGNCPDFISIIKFVNLPPYAALRFYPPDGVLEEFGKDKRLVIKLTNFEPYQTAGHYKYARKVIIFTDLRKIELKEWRNIIIAIIGTLLASVIAAWVVTRHVKPNHQKELEESINLIKTSLNQTNDKFDEINNKLNSQTEFNKNQFNEINQNLKKIENKIKPIKRKITKRKKAKRK